MQINLPSLGKNFFVAAANTNGSVLKPDTTPVINQANKTAFSFLTGKYLLSANKQLLVNAPTTEHFILATIKNFEPTVWHQPQLAITLKDNFEFTAQVRASKKAESAPFEPQPPQLIQGLQFVINAKDYSAATANRWHEILIEEVSLLKL